MTRTEQYLEEAQSFLDKGPFTQAEKERLSVLRDLAYLEQQENLHDEIRALKIEEMRDIRNILQEGLFQYQQGEKK